jgi:hypothetical protein
MSNTFRVLLPVVVALLITLTGCGKRAGEEKVDTKIVCSDGSDGADVVRVRIRNAAPGDAVKGVLKCGGIEVASCTATVPAGGNLADCDATSTFGGSGLAKSCPASIAGGNPNASAYTVSC